MAGPHLGLITIGQKGQSGTSWRQIPHSCPASQAEQVGGGGKAGGSGGVGGSGGGVGGAGGAGGGGRLQQKAKHGPPSSDAKGLRPSLPGGPPGQA